LCWYHHQLVDTQDITMHWTGKPLTDTTTGTAGATTATGTGTVTGTTGTGTGTTGTSSTAPGALLETGWAFTDARGHRITLPEPIQTPPETEAA
jgi:hypothetical protein